MIPECPCLLGPLTPTPSRRGQAPRPTSEPAPARRLPVVAARPRIEQATPEPFSWKGTAGAPPQSRPRTPRRDRAVTDDHRRRVSPDERAAGRDARADRRPDGRDAAAGHLRDDRGPHGARPRGRPRRPAAHLPAAGRGRRPPGALLDPRRRHGHRRARDGRRDARRAGGAARPRRRVGRLPARAGTPVSRAGRGLLRRPRLDRGERGRARHRPRAPRDGRGQRGRRAGGSDRAAGARQGRPGGRLPAADLPDARRPRQHTVEPGVRRRRGLGPVGPAPGVRGRGGAGGVPGRVRRLRVAAGAGGGLDRVPPVPGGVPRFRHRDSSAA
ncbi:hypothetical protein SAMN05421874_101691 [Nonomuraea maritima]|uniref:Uncharacterized protein n=1 Tax=Nonomuraea maritima TaxID=683260 RepID=A0A1G8TEK7_9ACTN|nr:hypothetical protein SAMN05421874_101691 [Nonomuraea maritima]